MILKKLIICALFISAIPHFSIKASYEEIQTQGLVYLGLILGIGGTYQLVKKEANLLEKAIQMVSGLALLATSLTLIAVSADLIPAINNHFK